MANLVYFGKELASNVFVVGGVPVPFEILEGNHGVIGLEPNHPMVPALAEAARRGVSGVYSMSADEYAQKKSNQTLSGSAPSFVLAPKTVDPVALLFSRSQGVRAVAAPAGAEQHPAPKRTPFSDQRPLPLGAEVPAPNLNAAAAAGIVKKPELPALETPAPEPAAAAAAPQVFRPPTARRGQRVPAPQAPAEPPPAPTT